MDESIRDEVDEKVVEEKATVTFTLEERIKELQSNVQNLASQIETYITKTTMKSSGTTYEAEFAKGIVAIYSKGHVLWWLNACMQ